MRGRGRSGAWPLQEKDCFLLNVSVIVALFWALSVTTPPPLPGVYLYLFTSGLGYLAIQYCTDSGNNPIISSTRSVMVRFYSTGPWDLGSVLKIITDSQRTDSAVS
jgi:hypothetical protein